MSIRSLEKAGNLSKDLFLLGNNKKEHLFSLENIILFRLGILDLSFQQRSTYKLWSVKKMRNYKN